MDEEEEAPAAAAASAAVEASTDDSCSLATSNAVWAVGSRLESKARDSNGGEQWFPAKVLEVEAEGRGVLVHYMQWNARHDEWIPSNSPRLRPAAINCGSSGKSSRHNSGGELDSLASPLASPTALAAASQLPTPLPAHKDFKPNEKVMATWKLNRKYLATVIKYEPTDGTYLVEFYDGVQCNVKPNNMRRPRKGEEDLDQQEILRVNGAEAESAENSDNDELLPQTSSSSSGRRERKRKFDVKELLNIRSVKSLRSNSKEDSVDSPVSNSASSTAKKDPEASKRSKRRLDRLHKSEEASPPPTPTAPSPVVVNGSSNKARTKSLNLEDGPALAAVTGKRERRKKKFWDEEQDKSNISVNNSSSSNTASTTGSSVNASSSALKRKSLTVGSRVSSPVPRKSSKKSSEKSDQVKDDHQPKSNGAALIDEDGIVSGTKESNAKTTGKENGKVLPYLQFDLTSDPELIAEKMIEGVNIPGMGQPIPVDSSSLPDGWEKRVIQRRIGITKGKWDVYITNPETGKSFRSKTELQKHLDERKLPYSSEAFDFSLDDNLKRLRQIWKQYKVKPFLNNPKGTGSTNFKHVPAKITQVQDSEVTGRGPPAAAVAPVVNNAGSTPPPSASSTSSLLSLKTSPLQQLIAGSSDLSCLTEIAVESETGQGLRCSISKCGKLFRNNRLLRQHIKHYHPKVYENLLHKHPQIGEDISEPTSPEGRRLSDSEHLNDGFQSCDNSSRKRKPSADSKSRNSSSIPFDENCTDQFEFAKATNRRRKLSGKRSQVDEDTPLSSMLYEQDDDDVSFLSRRTRNDSVLSSSVYSDNEDASVDHPTPLLHHQQSHQQRSSNCPPTPPTFRLSKRRQAQMRKRIQQPIIRVSKIDDAPLGRDCELMSLNVTSTSATSAVGSSATSPNSGLNLLESATAASSSSYPPSEMDASVAGSEHLTTEELVNCTCRRTEEDGLMIQCDICLCWQHGYCVGIEDEDPVPEKHVCETCRQPPGGRTESRFSIDQDWLKEGKLPSCEAVLSNMPSKWKSSSAVADKETAFRKLSELMADLVNLDKVLHGLRVKLHVASQPNNSKVFMWSSVWSLPTQQPVVVGPPSEQESIVVDIKEEAAEEERLQPSAPVDANAVADKLNMMTSNALAAESSPPEVPKVNGDSDSQLKNDDNCEMSANPATNDSPSPSHDHISPQMEEEGGGEEELPTKQEEESEEKTPFDKTENDHQKKEEPFLTNGKVASNDDDGKQQPSKYEDNKASNGPLVSAEEDEAMLDASFIPSLSEVERLLPSVIQAMDSIDNKATTATNSAPDLAAKPPRLNNNSAGTSTPPMFIPEPKRLDRDECRLNLLQHIASVQFEVERRFSAIEAALDKIETMPGNLSAGLITSLINGSESKIKTKLTMLLQDLAIARQLVWTL